MTHPLQYFKMYGPIVALSLPLGCVSNTISPQNEQVELRLKTLQSYSQQLEAKALDIESQIDEIRRAPVDTHAREIETLHMQFKELKDTHERLQHEMLGLRQDLKVVRKAD